MTLIGTVALFTKKRMLSLVPTLGLSVATVSGETLVFQNGSTMAGTVIQTNGAEVMVLTDCRTYSFSVKSIKEVKQVNVELPEARVAGRLPDFRGAVLALSRQPWAAGLMQIPATVIDETVRI